MKAVEGDHKACCEALYEALENLAGDMFLLNMTEINMDDLCEGSHRDALRILKRLQQYRSDDLKQEAIAASRIRRAAITRKTH